MPDAGDIAVSTPRISIALATYQGARFLEAQLDSLRRQATLPCELVIGDDGSSDGTAEIIERFAATAPFPVLFQRNATRLNYRANFIEVARRCTGDLIAFCDQDDVWHEDKLTRCAVPFADPDVMLVCHDANVIDAEDRPAGGTIVVRDKGAWRPSQRPLNLQYALTMVFRRCLNDHYDLWLKSIDESAADRSQHAAHDQWIYFLATVLGRVVNIDEKLLDYRQHGSNAIGIPDGNIGKSLEFRANYYDRREAAVRIRIGLLRELQERSDPPRRQHIAQLIPLYEKHLRIYAARAAVYGSGALGRRVAGVVRTAAMGGYAAGEFSARSMVSDLIYGVVRFTPGPGVAKLYAAVSRRA